MPVVRVATVLRLATVGVAVVLARRGKIQGDGPPTVEAQYQPLGIFWDLEEQVPGDRAAFRDRPALELVADRPGLLDPLPTYAEVLSRVGEVALLGSEGEVHDEAPLSFGGHV